MHPGLFVCLCVSRGCARNLTVLDRDTLDFKTNTEVFVSPRPRPKATDSETETLHSDTYSVLAVCFGMSQFSLLFHVTVLIRNIKLLLVIVYCKTRIVRVPFISRISRPWQPRENNGSLIYILAAIS